MRIFSDQKSLADLVQIKTGVTGVSKDGLFVNLDVKKLKDINQIFVIARKLNFTNEMVVNPMYKKHIFPGKLQCIDVHGLGLNTSFFFRYEVIKQIQHYLGFDETPILEIKAIKKKHQKVLS